MEGPVSAAPFYLPEITERPSLHKAPQRRNALLLRSPDAWAKWGWLVDSVSVRHGVAIEMILSTARDDRICRARRDLCTCLRGSGLSYPDIGRLVGMDHTSVMTAVRKELAG